MSDDDIIEEVLKDLKDLKGVKRGQLVEPDTEVSKNEIVIGEMDERLKRLYGLFHSVHIRGQKILSAGMEILICGREKDTTEFRKKISANCEELNKCECLHKIVEAVFWAEINQKFKKWERGGDIGVRKGFKVVVIEEKSNEQEVVQQLVPMGILTTNIPPEELVKEFEAFLKEKGAVTKEAERPITKH